MTWAPSSRAKARARPLYVPELTILCRAETTPLRYVSSPVRAKTSALAKMHTFAASSWSARFGTPQVLFARERRLFQAGPDVGRSASSAGLIQMMPPPAPGGWAFGPGGGGSDNRNSTTNTSVRSVPTLPSQLDVNAKNWPSWLTVPRGAMRSLLTVVLVWQNRQTLVSTPSVRMATTSLSQGRWAELPSGRCVEAITGFNRSRRALFQERLSANSRWVGLKDGLIR